MSRRRDSGRMRSGRTGRRVVCAALRPMNFKATRVYFRVNRGRLARNCATNVACAKVRARMPNDNGTSQWSLLGGTSRERERGKEKRENRATREQCDNELASMTREFRRMAIMRHLFILGQQPCVKYVNALIPSRARTAGIVRKRLVSDTAKHCFRFCDSRGRVTHR